MLGLFGWSGLPRPIVDAGQLNAMKLSHENQSKYGRNCSGVAFFGAFEGIGTVVGMFPLMTGGGIEGNAVLVAGGVLAVVPVVVVVEVVAVLLAVSCLQPMKKSAASAAAPRTTCLVDFNRSSFSRETTSFRSAARGRERETRTRSGGL